MVFAQKLASRTPILQLHTPSHTPSPSRFHRELQGRRGTRVHAGGGPRRRL